MKYLKSDSRNLELHTGTQETFKNADIQKNQSITFYLDLNWYPVDYQRLYFQSKLHNT